MNPFPTTNAAHLYEVAKDNIGKHLTLNPSVPAEVGCAEAVSKVFSLAGVTGLPAEGIPGTLALLEWLEAHPEQFEEITEAEPAAILVSATSTGNGLIPGHVGILGILGIEGPGIWGIMSNDSQTGLFLEIWNLTKWFQYYVNYGGLTTKYFRLK